MTTDVAATKTAPASVIRSWALFDFANTGFYVIMITLVFPVYFNDVLAGGNESVWGTVIAISMLITALIGPLLGSIADASGRTKRFLGIFTALSIAATIGLFFGAVPGSLTLAAILIILANIGFEGGTIFYDALLPRIAARADITRISAYGWAIGYAGSFLALILVMVTLPDEPSNREVRSMFLIAAGIFALFAIPLFVKVPEEKEPASREPVSLGNGYRRLRETVDHIWEHRGVFWFLAAFFFYNDGILTVIMMASIFMATTLNFTTGEQITFFLIVQATALGGSLLFGRIAERIGPRATIMITLAIWIGIVIAAFFVAGTTGFYVIGGVAGLALGSSQSTSRTLMALLSPPERSAEFFGFYDGFFGKASAVIGPFTFGILAESLGQRPAMLIIGLLFVIGALLLMLVPDVRGDASGSPETAG